MGESLVSPSLSCSRGMMKAFITAFCIIAAITIVQANEGELFSSPSELLAMRGDMADADEKVLPIPDETSNIVPEMDQTAAGMNWSGMAGIHDIIAKHTGECVTKFPCYMRSKVAWQKNYMKNYMLAGPIRAAITAIPGLTAYVCPVGTKSVSKWLKFNTKKSYDAFRALQQSAFNPHTRLQNFQPLPKCVKPFRANNWGIGCWMSAWVNARASFTVTKNPNVADVQSNVHSFNAHARNPRCIHCTPGTKCFKSSWQLKRL